MANKTTNYELTKPLPSEFYDVEVQNDNMDIIDAQMKALDPKSAAAKTTLADADTIPLNDSAASSALKKITWANVKTVLGNVFAPKSHTHTKSQISDFPSSIAPSAHASSHKTGGSDAISPSDIGAVPTSRTVNGKALSANISLTATDVGLGNVPNVATNNQTPTYSQAETLANISSGEKLSVSFGKIMRLMTDYFSHKGSRSNPHGVTAAQAGAVAKNEDIVIQKSDVTYETIFGQGTRNAHLRVRNAAGATVNQRTLALFDSTQRPDLETALRLYDVDNGTENIYSLFGEHNLDLLKTSLGAALIQTGSYIGTNTYGSSNPCSLTFNFVPKIVGMLAYVGTTGAFNAVIKGFIPYDQLTTSYQDGLGLTSGTSTQCVGKCSSDRKTFYWYQKTNPSAASQFNASGYKYYWVAIG